MAKTNNLTDFLTDLADGIRAKKGTSGAINPQDFRSEIESIETGTDTSDATATEDKVFLDETFYAGGAKKTGTFTIASEISSQDGLISAIKTALQGKASGGGGGSTPTQEKTVEITENGTVEVLPDEGYALSRVTANVAVPIPDGYIVPSGTLEVTENGTHDVTSYASVSVNVESSGGGGDATALLDALLNNTLTSIDSNVASTVQYACYGLTALKTANFPNLTLFGNYTFRGCTGLESVSAPKLVNIGSYVFYGCYDLAQIDMAKVTTVGTYAFYKCNLQTINMPLLSTITTDAFYQNENLTIADFGVAKNIAQAGLANCYALEALILRKSDGICTLATATNALQGTPIAKGTGYVYVPQALIETYKTATNWSGYAEQFRAIEDYPEITGG